MIRFRYSALDKDGNVVEDEHTAANQDSLLEYLKHQDLNPLSVEEIGKDEQEIPIAILRPDTPAQEEEDAESTVESMGLFSGVSRKETSLFTRQLSTTLQAGLPLLRTISLLHRETTKP